MTLPTPRVVLDANVLFSIVLCDTLMRAALRGLCRAHWDQTIFDTEQLERLQNPPQSVAQVLNNLSLEAPMFVRAISERMRGR